MIENSETRILMYNQRGRDKELLTFIYTIADARVSD